MSVFSQQQQEKGDVKTGKEIETAFCIMENFTIVTVRFSHGSNPNNPVLFVWLLKGS